MNSAIRPDAMHLLSSAPGKDAGGGWPITTSDFLPPRKQLTSQQSPVPETQLSIHVTGRRAKSTSTVKIL